MRSPLRFVACLAILSSSSLGFKFTSPSSDSQIDPSKSIVLSWSLSFTDPSVVDLKLTNSDSDTDLTIATDVVSYTGSYTVPAGYIQNLGSGYKILAVGNGDTLDQISGLTLGDKSGQSSSGENGQVTLVTTATVIPTPAASTTSGGRGATDSTVPTATIDSVGVVTLPGTVTGSEATTSPSDSRTGSSFATSTTSKASTKSNSAAVPSAGSTNAANGQKRQGGELALSALGLLAGVITLLA